MATTKITNPDLFDLGSLNTALKLPSGTTAERPTSPSTGEWRYNTTTNLVEYYDGGSWRELVSDDIPPIINENFNVVLYTGNGGTQSITGVGFQPDFVWLKNRSLGGYAPRIFDSTRGATNRLQTSTTNPNSTDATSITSFDADGFSVGSDPYVNNSGSEFVAWCWKANGGTTVSNGDGATTSTVQANSSAGFSIIKYTGTGSNTSVGHGLGTTPELIFAKNLDDTTNWNSWTPVSTTDSFISLNLSNALATTTGTSGWSSGAPTSSVVNLDGSSWTNQAGSEIIMYAFASKTSFSKMGSYTGNGSATGPTVTTGFEPAFLLVKRTDGVNSWAILDNKRSPSNPRNKEIFANLNDAESTTEAANFLTNGFQIITTASVYNNNGSTYIYMAFASEARTAPVLADSFANKLYTGTGVNPLNITGLGFSPSLVWIKSRDVSREHIWCDSVRGPSREISSSDTSAEELRGVTVFDSDGFTLDAASSNYNGASENYVSWNWKANTLPTINTDGTIQSEVSVNQAAGFSIIKFTTPSTDNFSVGHGLGAAPDLVFYKALSQTSNWTVYNSISGATKYLLLNGAGAEQTDSLPFNDTEPTSTLLNLGSATVWWATNANYIAYAFKSISGYSKIGTYTGNGSTQSITGVGFQPNWLMIKQINDSNSWRIFDSARGLSAPQTLFANLTNAEDSESNTVSSFDSDGWTMGSQQGVNDNGDTYLYLAIKENATPQPLAGYMSFLVIAGGGAGGGESNSGGGGAGGLRTSYGSASGGGASAESNITLYSGTYTITVGAGGGGGGYQGGNGSVSSIAASGLTTIESTGGGGGVGQAGNPPGVAGGSGGGGGYNNQSGGAGTANQGFAGGSGSTSGDNPGGGGGGASEAGNTDGNGHGGDGLSVEITGSAVAYAGGGSGGVSGGGTQIPGSDGGGGAGAEGDNQAPVAGTAYLGAGGGGGAASTTGANGGAGVVVLRILTSEYSGTTTGSPTVTTDGTHTILKYNGSGTYVHS